MEVCMIYRACENCSGLHLYCNCDWIVVLVVNNNPRNFHRLGIPQSIMELYFHRAAASVRLRIIAATADTLSLGA